MAGMADKMPVIVPRQFTRTGNTDHLGNHKPIDPPETRFSYGTAGFREHSDRMSFIAHRVGYLASLRARTSGKAIGVMITASHNPEHDNGVKIIDPNGEMLAEEWEDHATQLINAKDDEFATGVRALETELNDPPVGSPSSIVLVGRDTRASGVHLTEAVQEGVGIFRTQFKDCGLLTTPQLHFLVHGYNNLPGGPPTEQDYYKHFSSNFKDLYERLSPTKKYTTKLHLDCANGIGAPKMRNLAAKLPADALSIQFHNEQGQLNHKCGADFVKISREAPAGFESIVANERCAVFDGDADRLVYFYKKDNGKIELLDGDKITQLIAEFYKDHLAELKMDDISFAIVQTAHAKGNWSKYMKEELGVTTKFVTTGVKHLHRETSKYDCAIYFEANGHGSVAFSDKFFDTLDKRTEEAAIRLRLMSRVINSVVGNAMSDLLAVELILRHYDWTVQDWAAMYEDAPSKQIKDHPSTPSSRRGKRPPDGSADRKKSPEKPESKRARSDAAHEGEADPPNTAIQNPSQPSNHQEDQENEDPAMEEDSSDPVVNRGESVSSDDPPSDLAAMPQPVNPPDILASPNPASTSVTPQPVRTKRAPSMKNPDVRRMSFTDFDMTLPKKIYSGIEIDKEVEARKDETPVRLMDQVNREVAAAEAAGHGEWQYDYVVSTIATKEEKRKRSKKKIVIKGKGYPLPNIMHIQWNFVPTKDQEPYYAYWQREKLMDLMEKCVIQEFGGRRKAFLAKYPYRYSPDEEGVTESEFITNQISVMKGVLRSIEWRITLECDLIHQPPILFADWTGSIDRDSLPRFKYINEYMPSRKVRKAMNKSSEYAEIRCNKSCEQPSCDSALLNPNLRDRLGCKCQIRKNTKGRQQTIDNSPVECNDSCSCDPSTCGNRVIQRGRQHPVLVWKDWRKGWTLRTLAQIKKGDYVGEYVGEVITNYESQQRGNSTYFMDMPNQRLVEDPDEKNGRRMHYNIVIDALEYGNETRFISHSCDPNLNLVTAYVERIGGWYSRMAFIAKRDIAFGEELTLEYFPGYKEKGGDKKYDDLPVFDSCFCETEKCKFKFLLDLDQNLAREKRKQKEGERKQASALEGDSWDENSDTEEEKAERLKKQRASRKDRNEKRNNLKAKTEEEEAIAMAIEASESEMEKEDDSNKMEVGANETKKEEEDDNEIYL